MNRLRFLALGLALTLSAASIVPAADPAVPDEFLPWMIDPALPVARLVGPDGPLGLPVRAGKGGLSDPELAAYRADLAYLLGIDELLAVPAGNRPPLNAEFVGSVSGEGYAVYLLRYESVPGIWVAANLYVPDDPAFPLPRPAVINPHGHWDGQKTSWHVQVRCIGLARLGYVSLAYDVIGTGDRSRDGFAEGWNSLSVAAAYPGSPLSMGMQAYEVSRAVDYLLSVPALVDPAHISVTGSSGGGSQTIYGAAFDPRIEVVVPVAYGGVAHPHPFGTGDETIPLLGSTFGNDRSIVPALVYPAKVLFLDDQAGFNWLAETARDTYDERGASAFFAQVGLDEGHGYYRPYRERMYAWLSKWVLGVDVGETIADPDGVSDDMDLWEWWELQVPLPDGRETLLSYGAGIRATRPGHDVPDTPAAWDVLFQEIEDELLAIGNWPAGTQPHAVTVDDPDADPEVVTIAPEDVAMQISVDGQVVDWPAELEGEFFKPTTPGPWPVVVLLHPLEHPEGDADYEASYTPLDDDATVAQLVAADYAVLRLRPRFNVVPDGFPDQPFGYTYETAATKLFNWNGMPMFARHVFDLRVAMTYLESRADVRADRITLWGFGQGGSVAVAAAALDERACQCVMDRSRLTLSVDQQDRQPVWSNAPHFLEAADLTHLGAMVAPRRLAVFDPIDDTRVALGLAEAEAILDFAQQRYDAVGRGSELILEIGQTPAAEVGSLHPFCAQDIQTDIDLIRFEAVADEGAGEVAVSWETASERGYTGFHLWRSDAGGEFARLTGDLIPATGGPAGGAAYEWTDADVAPGEYAYRLEAVDVLGDSTWFGPVEVLVSPGPEIGCGAAPATPGGAAAIAALLSFAWALGRRKVRTRSTQQLVQPVRFGHR